MNEQFDSLPWQVQVDLREWFNIQNPDSDDLEKLAKLYNDGNFHAWDCPTCGSRVFSGSPANWSGFQGTLNQDFSSYPGCFDIYTEDTILAQCDDCRMSVKYQLKGLLTDGNSTNRVMYVNYMVYSGKCGVYYPAVYSREVQKSQ